MTRNPLVDKDFLKELDQQNQREVFAKVISLDFEENPVEEIEGRVTSGSVNIDGASAVRRSCSLSLVAQELNIHDFYWGLTTKFKLYVGLRNDINPKYPDIIWFPLGTYVISSFSTSQSTNSYTVSIQGKDKMCLLNGTMGGVVMALTADFGTETYVGEDGISVKTSLLIKNIIREVVHEYAREPYHNIIISDLDTYGLELMEYRSDVPMFLLFDVETDEVSNISLDSNQGPYYYTYLNNGEEKWSTTTVNLGKIPVYDDRSSFTQNGTVPTKIRQNAGGRIYTVMKAEYGSTVGYRISDLVYAGDLIAQVGSPVTTAVLDKIVSMLGDFEYFYDLYGRFIFQRKKTYVNTSWNNIRSDAEDKQIYVEAASNTSAVTYSFENANLITTFQNSPAFDNLFNDYSIWGVKTTVSGNETPVHIRCAIDSKPLRYKNYVGDVYVSKEYVKAANEKVTVRDWRELIYQMASDYMKHNREDDFIVTVAKNNPEDFPTGYTGYESYYTDVYSFWREAYNPDYDYTYTLSYVQRSDYEKNPSNYFWYSQCTAQTAYIKTNTYYYRDAYCVYQKIQNMSERKLIANPSFYYTLRRGNPNEPFDKDRNYFTRTEDKYITEKNYKKFNTTANNIGWNVDVITNPQGLLFWFDFLDTEGELNQYSVRNVGSRPKAENDSDVKAIYFRDIPNLIFVGAEYTKSLLIQDIKVNYQNYDITKEKVEAMSDAELEEYITKNGLINKLMSKQQEEMPGYTFVRIPKYLENLFTISSQGKSAKDTLDKWLYQYTYCTETISMTAIPIYYLEPNTRIYVRDDNSGINGEYILSKITLPLQYNGTMNISATKAAERIY